MDVQPTLIVIAGPTAVGKTGVAIELAKRLHTGVLSADSRQCYQGMSIGTAQPTPQERTEVPHYFVDCFPPQQALSAADFEQFGLQYIRDMFQTSPYAIVCGGTGLYIKALCEGLDEMPPVAESIAAEVSRQYETEGIQWLQSALAKEDPAFFAAGETGNPARMLRALSFVRATGQSILAFRTNSKKERPFRILKVALELPRKELYGRINRRVDIMLEQGLVEEVKALLPLRHLKNLNTVGYAELFEYFDDKLSLSEATDKIKQHSRNYAKRQLTWFRKDNSYHWLMADHPDLANKIISLL